MKWFFGILCLFFAAVSFGVRVHPENVALLFHREDFENYYELEFFSGQRLAGRMVSESAEALEISIGAGTALFEKNQIKNHRLLDSQAVQSGKYTDIIFRDARQDSALISIRYEDSVFYAAEKRLGYLLASAAQRFRKESSSWNPMDALRLARAADPNMKLALPAGLPLSAAAIRSSAARGFSSEKNQEQDYAALIKAGLEQLQNSAS